MMLQKNRTILTHIIGSLIFLSLPILFSPDISEGLGLFKIRGFQRHLFSFTLLLIYFYFNYFFLIPKFYFNKKYSFFLILTILFLLIICFLPIITIPNEHHHKFGPIQNHRNGFWLKFGEQLFRFIAIFALSLLIKIYLRWKQIEKDKVDIELSYLKAQINPHFLFNTLNSIYSLSIEEKAHKTSSSIVELSKMMRYVLTDSQMEFVSLDKEIDYIKSYIELQKTRLGDTLNLKFTLSGSFSNNQIAPILLIPFIENAFKYGINPEKKSDIILDINCEKDVLNFYVKNDIVTFNSITGEQIGQNNTINRIKLLYSNKYKLNIENSEKYYLVELKLNLK